MYGIGGERWLPEFEVPWLEGFERSGPVRIGNEAAGQVQIDVFGELIDTLPFSAWRVISRVSCRHR